MIADGERGIAAFDASLTAWNSPIGGAQSGGDWCEAFALSEHVMALTIGDVSGHGESVAEAMAVMRAAALRAIGEIRIPSDVLAVLNDVAYTCVNGVIATAIVAVLDRRFGTLAFANAGHPPPLVLTADGHAFLHQPPADLPLGIFSSYLGADYVVALPADALVVFYTDGITEHQRDPVRGEADLVEAVRVVHGLPELNAARAIARRVFRTRRGGDDAAALALRTLPASRRPVAARLTPVPTAAAWGS
ncbi:MAG: PP2C family protein-serine/threonine phosphatase [Candidatus Velthaea sp.]